jgi:hypothetical protein
MSDTLDKILAATPEQIAAGHLDREISADLVRTLAALVRRAHNEGFTEGMREYTTQSGGNTWTDSRSRKALIALVGEDMAR